MADSPTDAPVAENSEEQEQKVRKRRLGVDPTLIISDGRSKRRRTPSPEAEAKHETNGQSKDPERAAALGLEIYKRIIDTTDSEGDNMADVFMKLPSKKQFPDYYETIKHPLSLEQVKAKLDRKEYDDLKDVVSDLGQIFNNAKRSPIAVTTLIGADNVKESLIFAYAKKLHKMTRTFYAKVTQPDVHHSDSEEDVAAGPSKRRGSSAIKAEHTPAVDDEAEDNDGGDGEGEEDVDMEHGGPSISADGESASGTGRSKKRGVYMKDGPTVYKLVKPVLKSIRDAKAKDGSGRIISGIFETLPPRKDLPDYYAAIKDPISLQEIEERMVARKYETWEEFVEQVELMCSNAMVYNEDESEVYRDAQQIKDILDWHRKEIVARLSQPVPQQKVKPRISQIRVPTQSQTHDTPRRPSSSAPSAPSALPTNGYPYNPYPQNGASVPPPSAGPPRSHLPPLPAGVVNEETISSLLKYTPEEQRTWIMSLTPVQLGTYRQISANIDARRRIQMGQAPPPLVDGAASARPRPTPQYAPAPVIPTSTTARDLTARQKPPHPIIKHIDFAFTPASTTQGEIPEKHAIRLYNLRGIVTHHLIIGADTGEVEITAYTVSGNDWQDKSGPDEDTPNPAADGTSTEGTPVVMTVKGAPGGIAKYVYDDGSTGIGNGAVQDNNAVMSLEQRSEMEKQRIGYRWTLNVPTSAVETRVELISTRPVGGKETTVVYISRQF